MDLISNVFTGDAFSLTTLTDAINTVPFVPGRIGEMGLFAEIGITTTDVAIENRGGYLSLITSTPRGGPGETHPKLPRNMRKLSTDHFQVDDMVRADEVLGVREFGSADRPRNAETYFGQRFSEIVPRFEATLEFQRVGALKGIILDNTGAVVYNLFDEFTVEPLPDFIFSVASPAFKPRTACTKMVRTVMKALGGVANRGIGALVGDDFWDKLIAHPDVEKTYLYQDGQRLRDGVAYAQLQYGGILFENYRGYMPANDGTGNTVPFIAPDEARLYPVGVPNFFRTVFAPADYLETVGSPGLPRYAKIIPADNNKGARLEMQTNPLSYCTRPGALLTAKLG